MRENKNNGILEKELKEKLNWYTLHASEEEFDEKAVESILYLLDHTAPLEENDTLTPEEAWDRFQEIVENRQELLPLEQDKMPRNPYDPDGKKQDKKLGKFRKFIHNHKIFAAAALLILILAVSGTIQAGADAIQNNGFFFWMKRDDSGIQMMTLPEGLDVETDTVKREVYQNRDDLPDWTKEWLEIEAEFEMPENYEWQYYETVEFENRQHIVACYENRDMEKEIFLGVWMFPGEILYHEEGFIDYNYVRSYEIEQGEIDIYSKTEKSGEIFFIVCFYENSCRFYIRGYDNLDELKLLIEKYWRCVKINENLL